MAAFFKHLSSKRTRRHSGTAANQLEQQPIIAMKRLATCHHAISLRSHKNRTTAAPGTLPIHDHRICRKSPSQVKKPGHVSAYVTGAGFPLLIQFGIFTLDADTGKTLERDRPVHVVGTVGINDKKTGVIRLRVAHCILKDMMASARCAAQKSGFGSMANDLPI
jgi:hypothetical protein